MARLFTLTYDPDNEKRSQGFILAAEDESQAEGAAISILNKMGLPLIFDEEEGYNFILREVALDDYYILLIPKKLMEEDKEPALC